MLGINSSGYATTEVELNDGSVWVTKSSALLVGRVNHQINELDSVVSTDSARADVLQDGDSVLVVDQTEHRMQQLDVATVRMDKPSQLPAGAQVAMGGGILAVVDPSGTLRAGSVPALTGIDLATGVPLAKLPERAVLAVSQSGVVFAVAPGSDSLWEVRFDAAGRVVGQALSADGKTSLIPSATRLGQPLSPPADPVLAGPGQLLITTVGDVPVVLDRAAARIFFDGRSYLIPGGQDAVLQQPGPADPEVLVATPTGLLAFALTTGESRSVVSGMAGTPVAPVRLAGCSHGAWGGLDPTYAVQCGTAAATSQSVVGAISTSSADDPSPLTFRVNRNVIVLNDQATGGVWGLGNDLQLIDNWAEVQAANNPDRPDGGGTGPNGSGVTNSRTECTTQPVTPPQPGVDLQYGVRAGRSTVLRVLDRAGSSDCSMLTVADASLTAGSVGTGTEVSVSVVDSGQAIQVEVPVGASGVQPAINYSLSDGVNPAVPATLTVTVIDAATVTQPEQVVPSSSAVVEVGGTVSYDVLQDFLSPSGDDLYLRDARVVGTPDEVAFKPDGTIIFSDKGTTGAIKKQVDFDIWDTMGGHVTKKLTIDVVADGAGQPVAQPIFVRAVVGQPQTVMPLLGVRSPSRIPVQVTAVAKRVESDPVSAVLSTSDSSVVVTGSTPGAYYFAYTVAAGDKTVDGVLRVDVDLPPDPARPPVAMTDTVYLSAGNTVSVEPAANDLDPMAGGLAVQQITDDDANLLNIQLRDMDLVRVSARRDLPDAGATFRYDVSNSYGTATGEVRVIPVPNSGQLAAPTALPTSLKVRAGDAVTLPIATVATDPNGDELTVQPFPDGTLRPEQGLLFTSPSSIRYLAPATAPTGTVQFAYSVANTAGRKASAVIEITVTPAISGPADNAAPGRPGPAIARVTTGGTVAIPIPLNGIDPDGDWVTLSGEIQPSSTPLGDIRVSGPQTVTFTAFGKPGIDTFSYTAVDTSGLGVTGSVKVIIVAQPEVVQAPPAPDLSATMRLSRVVDIDILTDLQDGSADKIEFDADQQPIAPPGWQVVTKGNSLEITAPAENTVGLIQYFVTRNGFHNSGVLTIAVSGTIEVKPPTATDVFVTSEMISADQQTATIEIAAALLTNPGGTVESLKLDLNPLAQGNATVTGPRTLRIPLTDARQILAYRVTNEADNKAATALIVVPAKTQTALVTGEAAAPADPRPTPVARAPVLEVTAGGTVSANISAYVRGSPEHPVTITNGGSLVASQGVARRESATEFSFQAGDSDSGRGSILVPVSDGVAPTVTLSIPVNITPLEVPAPTMSGGSLDVQVGESASLDLSGLVVPGNEAQRAELKYATVSPGGDFTAIVLPNSSTLLVTAGSKAKNTVSIPVSVTDAKNRSASASILVRVTASDQPLARVADLSIPNGRLNVALTVDVLSGAFNPFSEPLVLVSAAPESGAGSAQIAGTDSVSVTPTAAGRLVVLFTVADATRDPQRYVSGRLTIQVPDRPSQPGVPTVLFVQSRAVQLQWTESADRGSPVTGYTVTAPGVSQDCPSTPCTIGGLANAVDYQFTVVAHSAVGDSDPSGLSPVARPDVAPDAPSAPTVVNEVPGQLTVSWLAPSTEGSPVTTYDLQISEADGTGTTLKSELSGTSYVWRNLSNGTAYRFQVRAHTSSAGLDSPLSAPSTPATPFDEPGAPTDLQGFFVVGNAPYIQISWAAPADNGSPITGYYIQLGLGNGQTVDNVTSARLISLAANQTYNITVAAINARGRGPSSQTLSVTTSTPPDRVTSVTATPGDGTVTLSWPTVTANGPELKYEVRNLTTGATDSTSSTRYQFTRLTNATRYDFNVTACITAGGDQVCGQPSETVSATPFGPLEVVPISAAAGNGRILFTWDLKGATHGTSITEVYYSLDDGPEIKTDRNEVRTDKGFYQTHRLNIRYVDDQGQEANSSSEPAETGPDPDRKVVISFGGPETSDGCSLGSCRRIVVSGTGWEPGVTYEVTIATECNAISCPADGGGGASSFPPISVIAGNTGSFEGSGALFGYAGVVVSASLGGREDRIQWPSP